MASSIFVDSCEWIDYIWYYCFGDQKSYKKKSVKLLDSFLNKNYKLKITPFLIVEISSHFKEWYFLLKNSKSGYSYREFKQQRKQYSLTEQEKEKIDEIIEFIGRKNFVIAGELQDIPDSKVNQLITLIDQYHLEFPDAFNIISAIQHGCKYFFTSDTELRSRMDRYRQDGNDEITVLPFREKHVGLIH